MEAGERRRAMEAAGRKARELHPELIEVFPDADAEDFWCWLHTEGWRADERLRAIAPPVPPPEVFRHSNTSDDWGYVLTSASTYAAIMDLLRDQGLAPSSLGRLLDFGCGPGRGLRLFLRHSDVLDLRGTDVDAEAIAWCREHLDFASFSRNTPSPPLDFEDANFGFAFSISVFSHFSARQARSWLEELARGLRPGALLALSVHGAHALERARREPEIFAMLEVSEADLEGALEDFQAQGFAFIRQSEGHLDAELYGVSFAGEIFIRTHWTQSFEFLELRPAAIDDWQDLVVLRKR